MYHWAGAEICQICKSTIEKLVTEVGLHVSPYRTPPFVVLSLSSREDTASSWSGPKKLMYHLADSRLVLITHVDHTLVEFKGHSLF
jgi:hypothetical protein